MMSVLALLNDSAQQLDRQISRISIVKYSALFPMNSELLYFQHVNVNNVQVLLHVKLYTRVESTLKMMLIMT